MGSIIILSIHACAFDGIRASAALAFILQNRAAYAAISRTKFLTGFICLIISMASVNKKSEFASDGPKGSGRLWKREAED